MLSGPGQSGDEIGDFPCLADQMSQAGLTVLGISVFAVDAPVGFVGVKDVGMTDFVPQLFMDGLGQMGGLAFEGHGGGWDKIQAEEMLEDFSRGAHGEFEFLSQEYGGGFSRGAYPWGYGGFWFYRRPWWSGCGPDT